jgi:hypothetical protein
VITNAVAANNSSITTVWSNAIPAQAKGRPGTVGMFFNMYSLTQFASNTTFDYGVFIDGDSVSYGESNTSRYLQTTTSTYAFSSNGVVLGSGGMSPFQPLSFPLYISPQATTLSIGIKNASVPFSPVQSVALAYLSNVLTSSGTSNTSNFVPQNTFTSTGQFSYTVPSLCSAGAVTGVFIYCWGAGGHNQQNGGWGAHGGGAGGGGGFVSGYYGCSPGTVLSCVVGLGGGSDGNNTLAVGGGFSDRGGFSGVFLSNVAASNAIGIAGAGGGAGYSGGYGGAGGYPAGSSGYNYVAGSGAGVPSPAMGGTQTAGGTGTGNGFSSASSQFFGAVGNQCCGGCGWYGGGQGNFGANQGGGGGSSYIGNVNGASGGIGMAGATTANGITLSNTSMLPGTNALPGGTTSQFFQSGRGHGAGGHGLVVIIPAVGTNPVYMGVNAKMLAV